MPNNAWEFYVILIFAASTMSSQTNNVCKTELDYVTSLFNNKNCWYNPDVISNTVDMIIRNGYGVQTYNVSTEDGHILTTYRVLDENGGKICRQPVFILHGLQTTSEIWVDIGNRSLAFFLIENGYDVWLGNFRGTPHSRGDLNYTTKDPQFWNWSFHEVGLYDISANLKLIREEACKCKIIYIGHSMGSTASYVYATLKSDEAKENLAGIISLAPVAFMAGIKTPLKLIAPFENIIWFFGFLSNYGIFQYPNFQELVLNVFCFKLPFAGLCSIALQLFAGFDPENELQPQDLPLLFSYLPTGGSLKSVVHYAQEIVGKGRFQFFDYGKRNPQVYGSKTPPQYPLEKINVPVHLIYGGQDFLGDPKDVQKLFDVLQTQTSITELPEYNHEAFLYGRTVKTALYPKMLEKMVELSSSCGN